MESRTPTPEERRRVWTTARIMTALAVLSVLFVLAVVMFRGCGDREVDRDMIDPPTQPLPGSDEVVLPASAAAY